MSLGLQLPPHLAPYTVSLEERGSTREGLWGQVLGWRPASRSVVAAVLAGRTLGNLTNDSEDPQWKEVLSLSTY